MPTPGYVFRDGGTTPSDEKTESQATTSGPISSHPNEAPQQTTPPAEAPLTQAAGRLDEVTDLGWKDTRGNHGDIDNLVGGLPNEDLWTLVRRFNKQMYHVKVIQEPPPGKLDLNIAEEEEFSPDKLRANIERLYMTIGISALGFGKHIARLRSWREPRRTGAFAAVYFLAWLLDLIVPTLFVTFMVLILVPRSRQILFPPAPLALVSNKTGGVQKPKAGVLGSHDSATGAPEKFKGEAVEKEASNFVNSIASVALASASGAHPQADPEDDPVNGDVPDPTAIAHVAADSKASAEAADPVHHDKTKQPMEDAVWKQMRPIMRGLTDLADGYERLANALSPTPPFSHMPRYRLASLVLPLLLVSVFTTSYMFMKANTFIIGTAFFTDPLMQKAFKLLNEKIPDWPKYLELRNTLLKGVPTNAQLTVTLLRIGEANRAPLPPPPSSEAPPPTQAAELDKDAVQASGLDATHSDIEEAVTVDTPSSTEESPKPKKKSKIVAFFKGTTAGAAETKLKSDNIRAAVGSQHAKDHLGILPKKGSKKNIEGPVEFKGRYKGKKGAVYVDSTISPPSAETGGVARPCVYFTKTLSSDQDESIEETIQSKKSANPDWAFSISDIAEIKKLGGLGWKAKIIVGWATEKEVKDGIEITTKDGKKYKATALRERDELFNRLIAIGSQNWESY